MQTKLCECGCGKETRINRDSKHYNRFIRGHNQKTKELEEKRLQLSKENFGICACGCGNKLTIDRDLKQYRKFLRGHSNKNIEVKEKKKHTCHEKYGVDNWSKSLNGKIFHRINNIRRREIRRENNEPLMPNIGDSERLCLNELEEKTGIQIIRNDPSFRYIIGRFPDGHIPSLKLFIQYDERVHFTDNTYKNYKEDDINCTLELASMGYIIFRISELQWKENKQKIIEDFKTLCRKLL
jgi:very-short-patch-repair endonuclease